VLIRLSNSQASFTAAADQPLLEAAQSAALNLPHSCKGGNCGACKARLVRGEIHYPNGAPLGLSAGEIAEGMILLCQARALTDLTLETFEVRAADSAHPKRLPCRIERALPLSHDVMGVFLRLPVAEEFVFEPGQYVDILLPGGRRRSFSIASPPHAARPLELHVRHVAGGEFTDQLFRKKPQGSLLTIEGPLGNFVYRPGAVTPGAVTPGAVTPGVAADAAARGAVATVVDAPPPMLLIGGGTGIAPLLSILRHVIENGIERDMLLYWGVRSEQDLYAHGTLEALSREAASLRYAPVLSEASPGWPGLTGWVHEAAFKDIQDLAAYEVYAAGPPAMIAAVRREFALRGVSESRLYYDSFDYAPDTLERQRMSAVTKS
jgi:CDP-4-dehydro-6-deoxyglucose reductase